MMTCSENNSSTSQEAAKTLLYYIYDHEGIPEKGSITIDELDLSHRARNALQRAGIKTVNDLYSRSPKEIKNLRGVGPTTLASMRKAIKKEGLKAEF